jgi:hypothetical protein
VVHALLILATIDDFNRSWRSIEDISCIIQSVASILWLEEQFGDAVAVFISCDKGNRKGIDNFPKVITSWWSKKEW